MLPEEGVRWAWGFGGLGRTLVSLIDSFKASRIVSTPCSSTKSRRLRGSSPSGLNAASTIVDRRTSIVDSSRALAASRVRMTFYRLISLTSPVIALQDTLP